VKVSLKQRFPLTRSVQQLTVLSMNPTSETMPRSLSPKMKNAIGDPWLAGGIATENKQRQRIFDTS